MNAPAYSDIVIRILSEIDLLLKNYVFDGYQALADYVRAPLGIIAAIYVAIIGYSVMYGWMKISAGNFMRACLKIGLIYMVATNWGWVSEYFIAMVNGAVGGIGDALIAATPVHIPGIDGIDGAMQEVLFQFTQIGSKVFQAGSWHDFEPMFDGTLILGFGYVIVGLGLLEIILAKVMLAILFVFTPVIIVFCYFKPLSGIFDRWLGAIIGAALLQLFVTAALTLALSLSYWWTAAHFASRAIHIGNYGTLPVVIIGIVSIGLIFKAATVANHIGGSVSNSSGAAMVGGMAGAMMGNAISGINMAKNAGKGGKFIYDKIKAEGQNGSGSSVMKDAAKSLHE